MIVTGILKRGEYFDSVSLMLIAKKISELEIVLDSAAVMGTPENKSMLQTSGLLTDELQNADDIDLMIAYKCNSQNESVLISKKINEFLKKSDNTNKSSGSLNPSSLESALKILPDANLAMISVAGKYAGDEAMKALQNGLNVMLFSDNVSVEKEIELKKFAKEKGLFVMGPDCGTAIINGVPLAFANVVNRGNIGIVAASGTGLQEVSCLISNSGCGISQAIGTGGRDVKKDVGGIMFLEGIKALAEDKNTGVILLISKPPADEVIIKIIEVVKKIEKPIVGVFLNSPIELFENSKITIAKTLEEGALLAVAYSKKENIEKVFQKINTRDLELKALAEKESAKVNKNQIYLRALFSGGTFCDETQMIFQNVDKDVFSNTPVGRVKKLKDIWKSEKHTIIDLGDDEFTVGRPHPMIDYSTRNKRILAEANDPETAVILLDIVLGYGSNMDPLAEIIPVLKGVKKITSKQKRYLPVICSVTGTEKDPQNRTTVAAALSAEEVLVMDSNAAASKLAKFLIEKKR
ncbi:MAG: FdrA family protein [Ignavibacteria bacterium CG_4_8_14_3_um_filter_37_9]|nr:MAG: FdrA family protein [Ignavibacteria bacterium CG_4_8_14_3_um_filter_37_9]PIX94831.1 MAG: FdrA family protein [Ignavibacteria bacterium CG_4_10_14_3_um_filter_37_18]